MQGGVEEGWAKSLGLANANFYIEHSTKLYLTSCGKPYGKEYEKEHACISESFAVK